MTIVSWLICLSGVDSSISQLDIHLICLSISLSVNWYIRESYQSVSGDNVGRVKQSVGWTVSLSVCQSVGLSANMLVNKAAARGNTCRIRI